VNCNDFLHFKRNVVLNEFCAAEFSLAAHFHVSFNIASIDTSKQNLSSMIRDTMYHMVAVLWYFAKEEHAL